MAFQRVVLAGTALLATLALTTTAARAQVPETFENLKHYRKDISRDELVGQMRQFSFALGVRCQHCHVDGPSGKLSDTDFASDDKQAKRTARSMLKMVDDINGRHIRKLEKASSERLVVACVTCHHGVTRPVGIASVLEAALAQDGIEGMTSTYKDLRESYYGGHSYDFKEQAMIEFASGLAKRDQLPAAIAAMQLSLEHNASSPRTHLALGQIYEGGGSVDKALEHYRKAHTLGEGWSKNFAQQRIEALTASDAAEQESPNKR